MKIAFDGMVEAPGARVGEGPCSPPRADCASRSSRDLRGQCRVSRMRKPTRTADQADRAVARGGRRRYRREDDQRTAGAAPRPAGRRRQPSRCGRQHRHGDRRPREGRRLHAAHGVAVASFGQSASLLQAGIRADQGLRAGRAGLYGAELSRRPGRLAGEQRARSSSRSPRQARASSTSDPEGRDPRSTFWRDVQHRHARSTRSTFRTRERRRPSRGWSRAKSTTCSIHQPACRS